MSTTVESTPCLNVTRRAERFFPQETRVIAKLFTPGKSYRIENIISRVLSLPDDIVERQLRQVYHEFADRHLRFEEILFKNFRSMSDHLPPEIMLSREQELLMGAYFTHEFSISSAALFNPSIIHHPDQSGLEEGSCRFIMSFRATGEGHISSVEFRSGVIDRELEIEFDPESRYLETPEIVVDHLYEKRLFQLKLREAVGENEVAAYVLAHLPEDFTLAQLHAVAEDLRHGGNLPEAGLRDVLNTMTWLAKSNYTVRFDPERPLSERLLFPVSENESRGIEDARFVRFIDDDGTVTYYATYTAYNGFRILPQLIETTDFVTFRVLTLNGEAVQDKGMALFPRRIDGYYVMLGRQDGESITLMYSDNIHFWYDKVNLQVPTWPWEMVQIGNNGSPIETEEGWLVLTHGVGPMRKYCLGCTLLDLNDPSRVIARLKYPLLCPTPEEREGYVPNVVYTCGTMVHRDVLIIPYAMSDSVSGIATVPLRELLGELKKGC